MPFHKIIFLIIYLLWHIINSLIGCATHIKFHSFSKLLLEVVVISFCSSSIHLFLLVTEPFLFSGTCSMRSRLDRSLPPCLSGEHSQSHFRITLQGQWHEDTNAEHRTPHLALLPAELDADCATAMATAATPGDWKLLLLLLPRHKTLHHPRTRSPELSDQSSE